MAVAARPGPSDARVPCPLCGGLIHPIAGKCKHCKADLTAYRSARPAADAPLPALHPPHGGNGHGNGHAGPPPHAPIAHAAPVAVAAGHEVQAVLPPRPTGRSPTAEPVATWRSWPVIVIALAMLAIIVAVVLMVWPASSERSREPGKHALQPPPAPERMQTEPDIKTPLPDRRVPATRPHAAAPDPWSADPDPPAQPTPQVVPPQPARPLDPADESTDADDIDLDALKDPFAMPHLNGRGQMIGAMLVHLCRKLIECHVDDMASTELCERIANHAQPPPPTCPAAARCLQHIDAMTCGSQPSSVGQLGVLMTQFRDCTDATRC